MAAKKSVKNAFVSAVQESVNETPVVALTKNGALTNKSSLDANVDFFAIAGASRSAPEQLVPLFNKAFVEDREVAARLLLWMRDAREGAGERNAFRVLLNSLVNTPSFSKTMKTLIEVIPQFGRWDDLLLFLGTRFEKEAVARIKKGLETPAEAPLVGKWLPRKGIQAVVLRNALGLSPKRYRKTIVELSNTVEQKLCAKNFVQINYSQVPSIAAHRYQQTFGRHDAVRYQAYKNDLVKVLSGETPSDPKVKVNASVIYPHQIVQSIRRNPTDSVVSHAQWEAMPNWLVQGENILPVVDVSASMGTIVSPGTSAMDVSIGVGLYIADKQKGPFKDMVLTFNTDSRFEFLQGDIVQKVSQLSRMSWGGSTSLQSAFNNILTHAKGNKVPQEDMPKYLLVISDMEFNPTYTGDTNFRVMKQKYEIAGYELPLVVFWNVAGRAGNSPATKHDSNVAMVSGFSPAIMQSILSADIKDFTPRGIMLKTVMKPRYDVF